LRLTENRLNRIETDESEPAAADGSDLRSTNPWLASYGRYAVRATRPPTPSSRNFQLLAVAGGALLLVLGIGATQFVNAEGATTGADQYPLDQNGGIAVSSANLDGYLATLEERATARRFLMTFGDLLFGAGSTQLGDREQGELVRMADFLRAHPETIAQIVGHADDRGDAAANSRLAEQRATVVRSYLMVQGIDQSRLTAVSGAEDKARAGNRRVAILVQKSPMETVR
jgi:OOP family OmpA-OmpF porin